MKTNSKSRKIMPRVNWTKVITVMVAVAAATAVFAVGGCTASTDYHRLSRDGYLIIEEAPRLIIGLYELPKDDEKLGALADNGFNLVRVPQDIKALDRLHRHGLYAWISPGYAMRLDENDENGRQKLTQIIEKFKEHPALLVWELPDEALWNVWYGRSGWVLGGQQDALRKQIEKARPDSPAKNITRWTAMLDKANDFTRRELWKRGEEIYDALWHELGQKNPHPDRKMSRCEGQTHELAEALSRGCRQVQKVDPKHIIWQNHAPRNSIKSLRQFNEAVDAAGCDIYPVPFNRGIGHSDMKDMNLSAVGAYTDRMRAGAPGKAIWMVLQGFGWRDINKGIRDSPDPDKGRRPNLHETRFMAYDTIVHGANAILYWGTASIEKDSTLWGDLLKVAREIRALEPAILGDCPKKTPMAVADETYGSIDGQGPRLMLRKSGEDWGLIAVNEVGQGISFAITALPKSLEGKTLYRLGTDESVVVKNRSFRDGIKGFDVHVYATSRRFEPKGK